MNRNVICLNFGFNCTNIKIELFMKIGFGGIVNGAQIRRDMIVTVSFLCWCGTLHWSKYKSLLF